ncbi:hypothetical protein OGAPHI_003814 [Ogataea philodendri]|uniref:Uncharacterized protein n=1 Tax=Ogataea philodendri TaxID=1378263 RepID=A0A9P8T4D5_9ASCO|nr:uncharacterized protein OGAPHI_003814 [Ogataea philodendri]KAH3665626.1 hypothetical protein OGAPHI_003814 [Ogataea philodendri]
MTPTTSTMGVAVFVEQEKTRDVGNKSTGTDNEDELRISDVLRRNESLHGFDENDVEHLNGDGTGVGGSQNTPCGAIALVGATAHLVKAVRAWVDLAWVTIALAFVVAGQTDTKGRLVVLERRAALEVDRVPADLGKGVSAVVHVETGHIWGPVSVWVGGGSPLASVLGGNSWRVDVEVGGSAGPVVCAWHGQSLRRGGVHVGWNQHLLVTRQNGLAESNVLGGRVLSGGSLLTVHTVVAAGDRSLELSVVVAVESSVLRAWVAVRGDRRVPLSHQLAWRTGVWTVVTWLARLVLGPAVAVDVGDLDKTFVGRERTFSSSFLMSVVRMVVDWHTGSQNSKSEKD